MKTVFEVFASLSGKDDTTVIGKEDLEALMDFLAGVGERMFSFIQPTRSQLKF